MTRFSRLPVPRRVPIWFLYTIVCVTAFITLFISLGLQLGRTQNHLPFFEQEVLDSGLPLWFAAFFQLSVVLSLWITTLLVDSASARRVALMGCLLAAYLSVLFALQGLNLILRNVGLVGINDGVIIAMFYLTLAECANGGSLIYAALQLFMLLVVDIILGQTDAFYQAGNAVRTSLETAAINNQWQQALFYIYYVLSGFVRWGALNACQSAQATDALERWWYRIFILIHMTLFWSIFAVPTIARTMGVETARLYDLIVQNSLLYSFTPLTLVMFMTLSRARTRDLQMLLADSDRKRLAAVASAAGRRDYLAYIFHEIRVPFSSIVLGLEDLAAEAGRRTPHLCADDVATMQASAAAMQQIMNDTLEVEKLCSGMYRIELQATNLRDVLGRTAHNFAPSARQAQVALSLEVGPDVPALVITDPNRIAQIAGNFVSNACKFCPRDGDGRATLRIRCIPGPPPQEGVVGVGTSPAAAAAAAAVTDDEAPATTAAVSSTSVCARSACCSSFYQWLRTTVERTALDLDQFLVRCAHTTLQWLSRVWTWNLCRMVPAKLFSVAAGPQQPTSGVQPSPTVAVTAGTSSSSVVLSAYPVSTPPPLPEAISIVPTTLPSTVGVSRIGTRDGGTAARLELEHGERSAY